MPAEEVDKDLQICLNQEGFFSSKGTVGVQGLISL